MSTCQHELHEYFAAESDKERVRMVKELDLCDACIAEIRELEATEKHLRSMHASVGDKQWQSQVQNADTAVFAALPAVQSAKPQTLMKRAASIAVAASIVFAGGIWVGKHSPSESFAHPVVERTDVAVAGFDVYLEKSRNLLLGVSALNQSCSDYTHVNVEDFRSASGQLVSEMIVLQENLRSHSLELTPQESELLEKIESILLDLHALENDALEAQVRPLSESAQEIVCMVATLKES